MSVQERWKSFGLQQCYVELSTIDDELRSTQRCYFYKGLAADTCLNVSAFRIPAVLAVLLK